MHDLEKFSDGETTLFTIDWERKAITTDCGDFYYDYDISFADVKRLYETIKSRLEGE